MAQIETVQKAMALLAQTWPQKGKSDLSAEIFYQVMEDIDDGDLMVATMQLLKGDREFRPTPGQVRAVAKDVLNGRMYAQRQEREQASRREPTPTTLQLGANNTSRLHEIPFNGDWEEYKQACQEQAKLEWEQRASWCPGFSWFNYQSLGGKFLKCGKDGLSNEDAILPV